LHKLRSRDSRAELARTIQRAAKLLENSEPLQATIVYPARVPQRLARAGRRNPAIAAA